MWISSEIYNRKLLGLIMSLKANAYLENLFYSVFSIGELTVKGKRAFAIISPVLSFLDINDARNLMFVDKEVSEIVKIYHDLHKFPLPLFSFDQSGKIQIRLKGNDFRVLCFDPTKISWNKQLLTLCFEGRRFISIKTKFTFQDINEYNTYHFAYEIFLPKIKARWAQKKAELKAIANEKQRAYEEREARRVERQRAYEADEQAKIDAEKKRLLAEKMRIGPSGYKPPVAPWAKAK